MKPDNLPNASRSVDVSQRRRALLVAAASASLLTFPSLSSGQVAMDSSAEAADAPRKIDVVIGGSTGVGISYLPLTVMVREKLLEKHAARLGIEVSAQWVRFPRSAAMYDALMSGSLHFASGGVSQLLASWDKTRTTAQIKGVGALVSMPIYLVSSNPRVKTIADLTADDRIALPEVRTSIQAVTLAMAAERAFGEGQGARFEPISVAMGHPEAMTALLDGNSDIDAHFSAAPLMYEELARPGIHKILDSYQVLEGPHTYNAVWARTSFHERHPKIYAAFVSALQEAHERIKADPARAGALWLEAENVTNMSVAQVEKVIRDPQLEWTATPRKFMAFATFMKREAILANTPASWRELFFDNATSLPGD